MGRPLPRDHQPKAHNHPGIRTHRAALDPRDSTRHDTTPATTPARTLLDLSSKLRFEVLRRATRQAQALRLVSMRQLTDVLARSRGAANLAKVVADGPAPTRSELDDAVLDLITKGGLQPPEVNVPLQIANRRVIPDFRWPAQRLVIEADGAAWHNHRLAREDDVDRQARLEAHGERVVRVTWNQAIRYRAQTLARLMQARRS